MQNRHSNRSAYFNEQAVTTKKYVIPYIEQHAAIKGKTKVLEIGCGEGGNLLPFLEEGCEVCGIDISKNKINNARKFLADYENTAHLTLICDDIYNQPDLGTFDIIFLRDVIEHIPKQEKFMAFLKHFIKENTLVFFAFPPWQNPFGGHQQICNSKFLSHLPYFHLLPASIYKRVLKIVGESDAKIKGLMEIKETGISIERFERILNRNAFKIVQKTLFFINPNYQTKFNLKARKQSKLIAALPGIRNFFTTSVYYSIRLNNDQKK